ncbi:hypothetical protein OESDEN_19312 [Oesophagostomum dentatum]|uniref:Uncharacterized protein n=1 Tax=Oesophagostomum dentatum TaxID=61180 RepID=A0A0B1SAT6_OESDE|nr:hypothetical protein OESDEN_19312 [Oesophagostomum dentatum]
MGPVFSISIGVGYSVVDQEVPPTVLIFDDVSVLERLGMQPFSIVTLLYKLYSRLEKDGLLLASFSLKTRVYDIMVSKADFTIDITPIGLGYGKDVTGKMNINIWNGTSTPTTTQLLYLTGDRSMKCFYPGGSSFLSI